METNTVSRGAVSIGEALQSLDVFKVSINQLLLQRRFFVDKIKPMLKQDQDYYIINGKKSLSKGGAEKLCQIYGLTASFERDYDSLQSFPETKGVVIFKCTLRRADGSVVGEGRGASTLEKNNGDINKCLKLAEKSSMICATLRSTFLSSDFTQDLEDMPSLGGPVQIEEVARANEALMISDRQKSYLTQLLYDNINDENEREESLNSLTTLTRHEASEMIASFVGVK